MFVFVFSVLWLHVCCLRVVGFARLQARADAAQLMAHMRKQSKGLLLQKSQPDDDAETVVRVARWQSVTVFCRGCVLALTTVRPPM